MVIVIIVILIIRDDMISLGNKMSPCKKMKRAKRKKLITWALGGPIPDAYVDSPSPPKEKTKKMMLKGSLKIKGQKKCA